MPSKASSPHQAIGQVLSTCLMTTVSTTQGSTQRVMRNLGFRPVDPIDDTTTGYESSTYSTCEEPSVRKRARRGRDGQSYRLRVFADLDVMETLLARHGRASHMGCRDHNYSVYLNEQRDGALYYKIIDKVALISGDPLCPREQYIAVIGQFQSFCKRRRLAVAMVAASRDMVALAEQQKWISMQFGLERVLDPLTNPLLLGTSGKRTISKCNQLLRSGMTVEPYVPSYQCGPKIESELVRIYNEWRSIRNQERGHHQAFITVFDILALPRLMLFICTKDTEGRLNGFAALRKLGHGYHVDPLIASADAPRGTTDLLLFSTMAFCREAGISELSLGFEPLPELGEIRGMSKTMANLTRAIHRRVYSRLPLGRKATFYQRFCPSPEKEESQHMIFFQQPGPRHMLAMMHFANIHLSGLLKDILEAKWRGGAQKSASPMPACPSV